MSCEQVTHPTRRMPTPPPYQTVHFCQSCKGWHLTRWCSYRARTTQPAPLLRT